MCALMQCRTRTPSYSWCIKDIKDNDVREHYNRVYAVLKDQERQTARRARLSISYLLAFAVEFNFVAGNSVRCQEDLAGLNGTQQGLVCAEQAWNAMTLCGGWTQSHTHRVRGYLARALGVVMPALVTRINPAHRRHGDSARCRARRSHEEHFYVHECLPLSYRRLSVHDARYRLLVHLCEQICLHTKSVSKGYVRTISAVLSKLLFSGTVPLVSVPFDQASILQDLNRVSIQQWIQRYGNLHNNHSMGFEMFKRDIRILTVLYSRVLCPTARITVPKPRVQMIETVTDNEDSSLAGSGCSEDDMTLRCQFMESRLLLDRVQARVCKQTKTEVAVENEATAFSVPECRAILQSCQTTLDKLLVMLFLTTGLRIGGVCRLKVQGEGFSRPVDVPDRAHTREKNGANRIVTLTAVCRILVYKWRTEQQCSSMHSTSYLFASTKKPGRPMSNSHVYRVCENIFSRAGLHNLPYAHPHTFRHTYVHMLYLGGGNTFEVIAKQIGHASPEITERTYCKLSHIESTSNIKGIAFLGNGAHAQMRNEWRDLAQMLTHSPWPVTDEALWEGLRLHSGSSNADRRARLRAESAGAKLRYRITI